jgi:hypothetical protein
MTEQQPIPVSWVSREDLLCCCPGLEAKIKALRPDEIEYIAGKIGDYLQETYWTVMDMLVNEYFWGDSQAKLDRDS